MGHRRRPRHGQPLGVNVLIAAELLPEIEAVMVRKLNEQIASDDEGGFRS